MDITFRLANINELEKIFNLFQMAIKNMNKQKIFQWDELYPDKNIIKEDIQKNQLYVGIHNNKIVCVYVLNQEYDEEYESGNWRFSADSCCVIHRLCVNPLFQNQGIGTLTMHNIEKTAHSRGMKSIRLDTYTQNPYSVRLYKKLNYEIVGYTYWRKGQFFLMEKGL